MQVKLKLFSYDTWGVYVKPINGISPGTQTITGTAQVTVVMPKNYPWTGLQNVSGTWAANAYVDGPMENPTKSYVSFGLLNDSPHINYVAGQETLLFKFKRTTACPDSIYIIKNATDPFSQLPNSVNSNPNNEFSVWDPIGPALYEYHSNYAPSAWSCHDNDGDNVLNAFEDTNGNGIFDAGDASDLNEHNGGLNLKLQLIEENKWGVYVKPDSTIMPGPLTITGTAQVTVVMPNGYVYAYSSIKGAWSDNGHVNSPSESPSRQYISFGLLNDFPHIDYVAGQETLLFTFQGNGTCPDSIYLIDNATDPFAQLPNSLNSNPQNEFSVWDPNGPQLYSYHQNYAPSAWSCHDNDGDGMLNAFEDTNGNGVYDAGVDVSDLNANCIPTLTASIGQDITVCHGEEAYFIASFAQPNMELSFMQWQIADNETGPWADIMNSNGIYTGVTQTSSDTSGTDTLTITNTIGLGNKWYRASFTNTTCDVPVYSGAAQLVVEGPVSVVSHPVDYANCATESATFTALVSNQGAGTMSYLWQYSTDGVTWTYLSNSTSPGGANYATVTTTTLNMANINVAMDGWYFRMRTSSNECGFVYSNPARLNVEGSITVNDQPDDVSSCSGGEAYFIASFSNAGNSYPAYQSQTLTNYIWQISYDSGATWSNLTNATGVYAGISGTNVGGTGSDTLNITNVMSLNGYQYRVAYTTPTCSLPIYSNPASLEVSENITFSDDPDDVTVCSGNDTVFVASASMPQGSFSFGWQYSDDNGVTWVDIDFETMAALFAHSITGEVASGTDILTVKNVAGMYGRRFRAVAVAQDCNTVYSNYAILSVEGPLTVNTHPTSVTECYGNSTIFIASFNVRFGLEPL